MARASHISYQRHSLTPPKYHTGRCPKPHRRQPQPRIVYRDLLCPYRRTRTCSSGRQKERICRTMRATGGIQFLGSGNQGSDVSGSVGYARSAGTRADRDRDPGYSRSVLFEAHRRERRRIPDPCREIVEFPAAMQILDTLSCSRRDSPQDPPGTSRSAGDISSS